MKRVFQIVLIILALFLAVLAFRSIMRPEKFRMVYELRKNEIRDRLITLRAAQAVYKNEYKTFADNIDSLAHFVNYGTVTIIKNVGTIPEKMSEADAFKAGLLKREVIHIPAKERILETDATVESHLRDFQFIPFTNGKKFTIQTDSIVASTYTIPVYRVDVPIDDVLANMDKGITPENAGSLKRFVNYILYNNLSKETQYRNQYGDMWMGSLTEANTSGSWEAFGN